MKVPPVCLIVLAPKTAFQKLWREKKSAQRLEALSDQAGASLIIGVDTVIAEPGRMRHYNSAAFVEHGRGLAGRYDKMHRVIFGEYIPLRETIPWLRKLTPFSDGFGIAAGEQAAIFELGNHRCDHLVGEIPDEPLPPARVAGNAAVVGLARRVGRQRDAGALELDLRRPADEEIVELRVAAQLIEVERLQRIEPAPVIVGRPATAVGQPAAAALAARATECRDDAGQFVLRQRDELAEVRHVAPGRGRRRLDRLD